MKGEKKYHSSYGIFHWSVGSGDSRGVIEKGYRKRKDASQFVGPECEFRTAS